YRITVDGERKQVWCKLCEKNRNTGHGSASSTAVRELAEDHMRGLNSGNGVQPGADLTVVKFWDHTYLPFITETSSLPLCRGIPKFGINTSSLTLVRRPCVNTARAWGHNS